MYAGVEIPVFCYEPRLGPAVGACRMCLVEIEGMPKLQAGCTLTAQDGMVVRTAATSAKAAEGQNATLEFILVNHPLDCPVCDKGGECPLQDLTFRYGPGTTRMTFPKRTLEKPIPVSPTIALDRERCILCYRCTRFSEGVAEDGQLVAVNRGALSLIATFEDEPYRAPFSGNVIELCPVGALTSTQYRFQGRPWEVQNVPTVCTLCPVGCNIHATTREGKIKRILSRNHPEVDEGWLCDKGRFAYPHLYAEDRITSPLRRSRRRGFAPISWDEALDEVERLLRAADGRIVTALSGSETVEIAYALGKVLRRGLGAHTAMLPEEADPSLDACLLPLSAIAEAQIVVILGDHPLAERAPVVDLWVKAARRRGADVVTIGPDGTVPAPPGAAASTAEELATSDSELGGRLREAERAVLIWTGPGGRGGAQIARLSEQLGLSGKPGCGALHIPATPNARGVTDAWAAASDDEGARPSPDRRARRLGRRGRRGPRRPRARRAGGVRHRALDVPGARGRLGRPRPAGDELPGARGHHGQPRRPPAAPPARGDPAGRGRARLALAARRALRRLARAARSRRLPRGRPRSSSAASRSARSASSPRSAPTSRRPGPCPSPPRSRRARATATSCACSATARSSPGRRSSARPSSSSSARRRRSSSRSTTPRGAASPPATRSSCARTAPRARCARGSTGACVPGVVRVAEEHARELHDTVEVVKP